MAQLNKVLDAADADMWARITQLHNAALESALQKLTSNLKGMRIHLTKKIAIETKVTFASLYHLN